MVNCGEWREPEREIMERESKFDIQDGRYGLDLLSAEELKDAIAFARKNAEEFTGTQFGPSARERYHVMLAYQKQQQG